MVRRLASLIVMAVFVAGSARTAGAQESASAGIAGQVLDATRAAVPGATVTVINAGTQFGAAGSSRSLYVTVEGGRDSSTNYAIDGVYVRSLRFNNLSLNPPLDAVQEINVLRNSFTTEYGQGQAVVSIVTKSGTNRFSGSGYDNFRPTSLEAENYFGQKPGDRKLAGFTLGGPVVKNKVFAFGAYEGLRTKQARSLFASVPNPAWVAGNFSSLSTAVIDPVTQQPFPGNLIPSSQFS